MNEDTSLIHYSGHPNSKSPTTIIRSLHAFMDRFIAQLAFMIPTSHIVAVYIQIHVLIVELYACHLIIVHVPHPFSVV